MFDTEKLISLVQSNPCLWDKSSKDYADRTLKNTCWQNIAESMHANWRELSNFQRDEKIKELRDKKWKNIRDNYKKCICEEKNGKSGSRSKKKKPYMYIKALSFLKTSINKRRTICSIGEEDNSETNVSNALLENSIDRELIECEPTISTTPPTVHFSSNSVRQSKKIKSSIENPFQKELIEILRDAKNEDLDKIMLNSFLPYVRKLDYSQKLDFQIHVLQFFKNLPQPTSETMQQTSSKFTS